MRHHLVRCTMTITIQTPWTYELFDEAMVVFERSLNRTIHIKCPHDTKTMLENIAAWSRSRGHSVITVDEDRMIVTVKKKPKKTIGVYQPSIGPSKPPAPPTSGSNAVKPSIKHSTNCNDCGRFHICPKSRNVENYKLRSECSDFISEVTYDSVFNKGKYGVHTYEEFVDRFRGLPADQEWELIKLYDSYIEALKKDWNARYTYCSGCFKDVRRDNTYTELTKDGKLLIKCKNCDTVWYVRDAEGREKNHTE